MNLSKGIILTLFVCGILALVFVASGTVTSADDTTSENIACFKDSDCGTDGFVGEEFCYFENQHDKVMDTYVKYECKNKGKSDAICTNKTEEKKVDECKNSEVCFNAECVSEEDMERDDSCLTDAALRINFIRADINGEGNLERRIFVDGEQYGENDSIRLSDNDKFITDGYIPEDVPGISVQRMDGQLRFLLFGEYRSGGSEDIVAAEILLDNAIITGFENDKMHKNSKLESQGNDKYKLSNPDEDEVFVEINTSRATWFSTVRGGSDGFFLDIQCKETGTAPSGNETVCRKNVDCGVDGFIDQFCSEDKVKGTYASYTCKHPGTQKSFCEVKNETRTVEKCDFMCSNGLCIDEEGPRCNSDAQCNDNNPLTVDQCINPGTNISQCRNTAINCASDNDCGIDGFIGEEFCSASNVKKNFQDFSCVNAGTTNSFCKVDILPTQVDQCEFACSEGGCARCDSNNDCNDNNPTTQDSCVMPGTQESYCVNSGGNHTDHNGTMSCIEAKNAGLLQAFIRNNSTTAVIVNHANQSFNVGVATYKAFDSNIDNQQLFDFEHLTIGAHATVDVSPDVPSCRYQIDVFCGEVITNLSQERYNARFINATFGGGLTLCVKDNNGNDDDDDDNDDDNDDNDDRDDGNSASQYSRNTYLNNSYFTDADAIYLNSQNAGALDDGKGKMYINSNGSYDNQAYRAGTGAFSWAVIALLIVIILTVVGIIVSLMIRGAN